MTITPKKVVINILLTIGIHMIKHKAQQLIFAATALLFFASANNVCAKEIVLAFDKTLSRSTSLDGMARAQMIVRNLAKVDVNQSMFLIRTKDINPKTIDRLKFYDDAGQLIVNAGAKYSLYTRSSPYVYEIDILKADAELS